MTENLPNHDPRSDAEICAALAQFGVSLSQAQTNQVRLYMDILVQWNKKINLTSIVNPSEILMRHFGESMFAVQFLDWLECRLSDIGSGAGFPGLAMKLLAPSLDLYMVEANRKKASFLSHLVSVLELDHATVQHARYEALTPTLNFDVVCSRALGNLGNFLKWARSRLSPGGQVILWLGELDSRSVVLSPGWSWREPIPVPLSKRRLLVVGKPIET